MSQKATPDDRNRPAAYYRAAYLQAGLQGATLAFLFAGCMQDYMVPIEDYTHNGRVWPVLSPGGLLAIIGIVTFACSVLLDAYLMKWRKPNAGSFRRRLLAACGIVVLMLLIPTLIFLLTRGRH